MLLECVCLYVWPRKERAFYSRSHWKISMFCPRRWSQKQDKEEGGWRQWGPTYRGGDLTVEC